MSHLSKTRGNSAFAPVADGCRDIRWYRRSTMLRLMDEAGVVISPEQADLITGYTPIPELELSGLVNETCVYYDTGDDVCVSTVTMLRLLRRLFMAETRAAMFEELVDRAAVVIDDVTPTYETNKAKGLRACAKVARRMR